MIMLGGEGGEKHLLHMCVSRPQAAARMQGPVSPATAANHETRVLALRLDQSVSKSDESQPVAMTLCCPCALSDGWLEKLRGSKTGSCRRTVGEEETYCTPDASPSIFFSLMQG